LAVLVLLFYLPALSPHSSIQFDTADVHYPVQKYVADRLWSGNYPFWTPYVFSGYPLAANPKVGAWYPLNWPFLLNGITPRSLQWELLLHAWIACLGAYYFIARLVRRRAASMLGALCYGLSGFFASHSGQLDLFMAAAWFPWLLLCYRRTIRSRGPQDVALGALVGALIVTTGSLAGAEFAFTGLALYALAVWWKRRRRWKRWVAGAVAMAAGALWVAAAPLLQARQLAAQCAPAPDFSAWSLAPQSLLTLLYANAFGALADGANGRLLEHYLYAGALLLPLAALGVWKSRHRTAALALIVPMLWYMLGPQGGLYLAGRLIPGWQSFGPPVWGWFVPALGLAMLAAAGTDRLARHWRYRYRVPATRRWRPVLRRVLPRFLCLVVFADLWALNMAFNPRAFARASWADSYGLRESVAQRQLARPQLPLHRFHAPGVLRGVGPALESLDLQFETTYGYFAWELQAYRQYRAAAARNPKLLDGLNVSRYLSATTYEVEYNQEVLPRAYFPPAVTDVNDMAESLKGLAALDPHDHALVLTPHPGLFQDPQAELNIQKYAEQSYAIRYHSRTPSLMKVSVPWYPGWHAAVQGSALPILRVDHALMGVVVPPGDNLLQFDFRPESLGLGLWTSAAGTFLVGLLVPLGVPISRMSRPARRRKYKRRL